MAPASEPAEPSVPRFACDAMCGGLARWLRAFGYDTFYRDAIDDGELVELATRQARVVISSDTKLFERRVFTRGPLQGLMLPHGLRLLDQVRFVVVRLELAVREARCVHCNGELVRVAREAVGDVVPARSLVWAREFFRCRSCGQVFRDGTHWQRVRAIGRELNQLARDEKRGRESFS